MFEQNTTTLKQFARITFFRLIRFLGTFELKRVDMLTYPKVLQELRIGVTACPRAYCIMGLGFAATVM